MGAFAPAFSSDALVLPQIQVVKGALAEPLRRHYVIVVCEEQERIRQGLVVFALCLLSFPVPLLALPGRSGNTKPELVAEEAARGQPGGRCAPTGCESVDVVGGKGREESVVSYDLSFCLRDIAVPPPLSHRRSRSTQFPTGR